MKNQDLKRLRREFDTCRKRLQSEKSLRAAAIVRVLEESGYSSNEVYCCDLLGPHIHIFDLHRLATSHCLNELGGLLAAW